MIISNIIGGLGNQMFQYATARALSLDLGVELVLDTSSFSGYSLHQGFELKRLFNISADIANHQHIKTILGWQSHVLARRIFFRSFMKGLRKKSLIVEPTFNYWEGIKRVKGDCYLMGYWQSESYFLEIESKLRQDFAFKLPFSARNEAVAHNIKAINSVSLHVRRGDYISNSKNASIYSVLSLDYYANAIAHVVKQIENPYFFIFSDDIDWCKNNLKLDFPHQYISHNKGADSYNDMRLMSLCSHHIIANSSFSWWGAWLNPSTDKIVVAPKRWFANNTNVKDLLPENWLKL